MLPPPGQEVHCSMSRLLWGWCLSLCPSTRPWDPLNDLIQFEKDGCIQTKVRHRTPMVRSASVVSLSTQQGSRRDNYLSQVRPSVPTFPSFYPQSPSLLPSHHRLPSLCPFFNQPITVLQYNQSSAAWPGHMTVLLHFQLLFFLWHLQLTHMHACVISVCCLCLFFGCIRNASLKLGSKIDICFMNLGISY